MAESTLSITYQDLQVEVARFAGWDSTAANWDTDQSSDFDYILERGLRRFYFPPPAQPGEPRHEWSFLHPTTTLALLSSDWDYNLPDDFADIVIDSVSFQLGSSKRKLTKIHPGELVAMQGQNSQSGTPQYYAIRHKGHAPTTGHREEMLVYPTPNGSMTLVYQYVIIPDVIDATNKYPYGGAEHSETLLEAILSAVEDKIDDDPEGPHYRKFMLCLGASIRLDKEKKQVPERHGL